MSLVSSNRSQPFAEINVTPLTDVMLVLLITFLLSATSFESSSLSVPLPQVAQASDIEANSVVLTIDESGAVDWPDPAWQSLSPEAAFKALLEKSSEPILALAVHRDCTYGKLFPLIAAASESGWPQILLLTESEQ